MKKTTAKGGKKKRSSQREAIIKEIISIVMIAASVFFILGVFTNNSAGAAGNVLGSIFRGFFGIGAYVLPFAIIAVSLYVLFDKEKTIPLSKSIMGIVLFLLFISFAHIVNTDTASDLSAVGFVAASYSGGSPLNGGLFGAVAGSLIVKLLGQMGAYIFIITCSIILVMLLTGRSFFEGVQNFFSTVRDTFAGEDEYYDDVEYYDDDDDGYYNEEPAPKKEPKPARPAKKAKPEKTVRKTPPSRQRAEIYDFEDGKKKRKRTKVLLPLENQDTPRRSRSALDIAFEPIEEPSAGDSPVPEASIPPTPVPLEPIEEETTEREIKLMGFDFDDLPETPPSPPAKALEPAAEKPVAKAAASSIIDIHEEIKDMAKGDGAPKEYEFPSVTLLRENRDGDKGASKSQILQNTQKLEDTLKSFGVEAKVIEVSKGPSVTRYELSPGQGVKVSKISNLADDLALNLAANGIRIEAPIPGKAAVGIEVPNKETQMVYFREVIEDEAFEKFPSKLAFGLGKDIAGKVVVADIGKMPHLLIAGATGSGKSVCINTLVNSIIYKAKPEEVKLIMIDPKVVELSIYNGIPHLMIPVVTDPKKAAGALNWGVREMEDRYKLFAAAAVRDLKGYNEHAVAHGEKPLPQIIIIIDELADLMMAAPGEVENAICRLAQMARAAGLHLIIATQRPSVDVITGVIKANIPSRLAFSVSSGVDSRTILDMVGAEKLLGKGDMLFYPIGMNKPMRVQGAFISDEEVESIVEFLKKDANVTYDPEMEKEITSAGKTVEMDEDADELFEEAVEHVIQSEKASASMLQRKFRIGYNRASRLIDDLEAKGIVGPEDGSKPRKVLITLYQWQQSQGSGEEAAGTEPVGLMEIEAAPPDISEEA